MKIMPVAQTYRGGKGWYYSRTYQTEVSTPSSYPLEKCIANTMVNTSSFNGSKLPIYIGYDPKEKIAFDVCVHSILSRTDPSRVIIIPLIQKNLRDAGLYWRMTKLNDSGKVVDLIDGRPFSTEFSFTRFLVPALSHYRGAALYLDSDFLVLDDIRHLLDLYDPRFAVQVVKHDYKPTETTKMDGQVQEQYNKKNWSSLVLWNCEHRLNEVVDEDLVNEYSGSFLHQFRWLDNTHIGELPDEWNYLVGWHRNRNAKAVHFTLGIPMTKGYESCDYSQEWWEEYAAMMRTNNPKKHNWVDYQV